MESTFDIVPAIPVAYGRVVGDAALATVPSGASNPLSLLWYWIAQGARRIHVEDLSADFGLPTIPALLLGCCTPVDIGVGGIIHDAQAARVLAARGAASLVLHRVLYQTALFQRILSTTDPRRLMPSIDVEEVHDPAIGALLVGAHAKGVRQVLISSPWGAPRVWSYQERAIRSLQSHGFSVWAAGGIRHVDTIRALKDLGLAGVLVGRALHHGVLHWDRLQTLTQ